jgi:hypothetical protein
MSTSWVELVEMFPISKVRAKDVDEAEESITVNLF